MPDDRIERLLIAIVGNQALIMSALATLTVRTPDVAAVLDEAARGIVAALADKPTDGGGAG